MECGKKTVKIRYGEKTFLLDEDSTIQDFLKSQHLDQLKMIVIKKVDDCLVLKL
jgi:sulfur carrier protein ThiS